MNRYLACFFIALLVGCSEPAPVVDAESPLNQADIKNSENALLEQTEEINTPPRPKEITKKYKDIFRNTLGEIIVGINEYHDALMKYPDPAIKDKEGKSLLSWRVQLLPFMGHQELYEKFNLEEPWDSKHNLKLVKEMPDFYRNPFSNAATGHTQFLAPVGKRTIWELGRNYNMANCTDGTGQIIMLICVEDEASVIWTKPEDLNIDFEKPKDGLAHIQSNHFLVLMAYGSPRLIKSDISKEAFQALLQMDDGVVLDLEEWATQTTIDEYEKVASLKKWGRYSRQRPPYLYSQFIGSQNCTNDALAELNELSNHLGIADFHSITLNSPRVTGEGLKHLSNMSSLEELICQGTSIADDGLVYIAEMKNLKNLSLRNSQISGEGLVHLSKLNNLERLTLYGTSISDEALVHLMRLGDLKELNLLKTNISEEGFKKLRAALPNCRI
ncbi:MAG: hypothetical protein COA78_24400 [Blastopirellula sp.]|nr:MAG: hypothetical protein COA78_24400 [Blastopirellula sp.]